MSGMRSYPYVYGIIAVKVCRGFFGKSCTAFIKSGARCLVFKVHSRLCENRMLENERMAERANVDLHRSSHCIWYLSEYLSDSVEKTPG